jgi:hypothetical protein
MTNRWGHDPGESAHHTTPGLVTDQSRENHFCPLDSGHFVQYYLKVKPYVIYTIILTRQLIVVRILSGRKAQKSIRGKSRRGQRCRGREGTFLSIPREQEQDQGTRDG